jgi:hypothetical protein
VLLLSYDGQKPLSPEVHAPLADWVRRGGVLLVCDADADPYLRVREWWNTGDRHYATPREHLFEVLGLPTPVATNQLVRVGRGGVYWLPERPAQCAASATDAERIVATTHLCARAAGLKWRETNYLLLRRGPYVIGAGLDESVAAKPRVLRGRYVNLFDPKLRVVSKVVLEPGTRWFLLDLDRVQGRAPRWLAAAGPPLPQPAPPGRLEFTVEGVGDTPAVVLLAAKHPPGAVTLAGQRVDAVEYSKADGLVWLRFTNAASPRVLSVAESSGH